jgi:transcriptional regulator with XRE-family HTH domain
MSELNNNSLREELIKSKDDKEYRHAYADENLNATIATQIKVLREQRDWKQEDLAEEAGMKQPMISRYENVNYSSWSINTLKKLAEAFDVYLDVRFRSFRELVDVADHFSREILQVPKFTEDPCFFEAVEETAKEDKDLPPPEEVAPKQKVSIEHFIGRSILSDWWHQAKAAAPSIPEHSASSEAIALGQGKPANTALVDALLPKDEDYQDKAA